MTKNVAFVFPGQGSQEVGMGKDLAENYPAAREVFEQADLEPPRARIRQLRQQRYDMDSWHFRH